MKITAPHNIKGMLAAVGLAILATAQAAFAEEETLELLEKRVLGSGCKLNTVGSNLSPDEKALSLIFDEFFVETIVENPFVTQRLAFDRKFCRIELTFAVPFGMEIALANTDFRGFADLDDSARASLTVLSLVNGRRQTLTREALDSFSDPDFHFRRTVTERELSFVGCGQGIQKISLHNVLSLRARGNSIVALDSFDSEVFEQEIEIVQRRCQPSAFPRFRR